MPANAPRETMTPATYAAHAAQAAATVLVATDAARFGTAAGSVPAATPDPLSATQIEPTDLRHERRCPRCGATVAIGANLCQGCGSTLPALA